MKETNADLSTELAIYKNQETCFEINQEKYNNLERCYQKSVYQEQCLTTKINALHLSSAKQITTLNEEIANLNNQLSKEKSTVSFLLEEKERLKSDFKTYEDKLLDKQIQLEKMIKELDNILHDPPAVYDSEETLQLAQESRLKMKQLNKEIKPENYAKINQLSEEADASLDTHKALEFEIERLLRVVVSRDIMFIVQRPTVVESSDLQTELERYNDMQNQIERLQAQLGDLKGKSMDTQCVSDTLDPLSQKLEDENKHKPKVKKTKKVGSKEILASPKPRKPRTCLRWSPTERLFDLKGKLIESSDSECQSDSSNGDNACTSNPHEPTRKQFPNSSSFLGRKKKKGISPTQTCSKFKQRLHLLHMDLCGPMGVESINGKRYVLMILDDYSRYTWVHFLRSKDEAPKEIKTFLKKITVLLQALVIIVRTENNTEFKNRVLKEYFDSVGISHQSSFVRTCQRNGSIQLKDKEDHENDEQLDVTYAPSTITPQKPIEHELDLLFEAMCDDYIGGQSLVDPRTAPAAPANQNLQTPNASTILDQQQHVPQQDDQAQLQLEIVADNVPNTMSDGDVFENPFALPSTSADESSSS
ncbi:putative ribonuclease H-like domain-containing protein [Tanacetum coccineum]